jgi:hypothetical protein
VAVDVAVAAPTVDPVVPVGALEKDVVAAAAEQGVVPASAEEVVVTATAKQALVSPRSCPRPTLWARQPLRQSAEPARLGGRGRSPPAQVEVRALVQQHVAEHNPDPHLSIVVRREQRRVDPRLIDVPEPVEESSTGWKAPDLAAAARTWEVVVAGEALPPGLRRGELSS